jgi:hypothetical protein
MFFVDGDAVSNFLGILSPVDHLSVSFAQQHDAPSVCIDTQTLIVVQLTYEQYNAT